MNIQKIRTQILVFLTHKIGMPYFKLVRKPVAFPYQIKELQQYPEQTVAHQLYKFLHDHQLDLLPYYEKHDIKHVLLDYPPTEKGEVSLQCFMLANGRITLPVLLAVGFGLLTMPEYWRDFGKAFRRGYQNKSLQNLNWFDLLPFSKQAIQAIILQPKQY